MNDPWIAPYSIKIMHDFLDEKYYSFIALLERKRNVEYLITQIEELNLAYKNK